MTLYVMPPPKKVVVATSALQGFINKNFVDDYDRCMLATFGSDLTIRQDFTSSKSLVLAALSDLPRLVGGKTMLYDSMHGMCEAFWRSGKRDRRWVWLTITDGMDNMSTAYSFNDPLSPARIGRFLFETFNGHPSNHPFLIGCGKDKEIDKVALGTVGYYGQFPAVTVEGCEYLHDVFRSISHDVFEEFYFNPFTLPGHRIQVQRHPIDIGLLIDVSGSMNDPVSKVHLN